MREQCTTIAIEMAGERDLAARDAIAPAPFSTVFELTGFLERLPFIQRVSEAL